MVRVSLYWEMETKALLHFMPVNFHVPSMEGLEESSFRDEVFSLFGEDPPQAVKRRSRANDE